MKYCSPLLEIIGRQLGEYLGGERKGADDTDLSVLVQSRQKLESQRQENEGVKHVSLQPPLLWAVGVVRIIETVFVFFPF